VTRRGAVSTVIGLVWGFLLYLGVRLYLGVARQGIAGYPNISQTELYLVFPTAMVLLSICLIVFLNRTPKSLFFAASLLQFASIFPFIVLCTGGI
jgi:hypothetical protein